MAGLAGLPDGPAALAAAPAAARRTGAERAGPPARTPVADAARAGPRARAAILDCGWSSSASPPTPAPTRAVRRRRSPSPATSSTRSAPGTCAAACTRSSSAGPAPGVARRRAADRDGGRGGSPSRDGRVPACRPPARGDPVRRGRGRGDADALVPRPARRAAPRRRERSLSGFALMLAVRGRAPRPRPPQHHSSRRTTTPSSTMSSRSPAGPRPGPYVSASCKTDPAAAGSAGENWFVLVNAPVDRRRGRLGGLRAPPARAPRGSRARADDRRARSPRARRARARHGGARRCDLRASRRTGGSARSGDPATSPGRRAGSTWSVGRRTPAAACRWSCSARRSWPGGSVVRDRRRPRAHVASGSRPFHRPRDPYGAKRANSSSEYQPSARVRSITARCSARR